MLNITLNTNTPILPLTTEPKAGNREEQFISLSTAADNRNSAQTYSAAEDNSDYSISGHNNFLKLTS